MDYKSKLRVIDEIRKHVDVFVPVPPIRYRIRCPFCGDSQKDLKDSHLYIKCTDDPDEPLLYKCFLANCLAKGKVDRFFLKLLGINNKEIIDIVSENKKYNRIGLFRNNNIDIITGKPVMNSAQVGYIEKRLGKGFTEEDLDKFKIIWDISSIIPYMPNSTAFDKKAINTLPGKNDVISFISEDKSLVAVRSIIEDGFRWKKIYLSKSSINTSTVYTLKVTLDLFTQDPIEVNIAEGIFDILSVYKNFNKCKNSVFISVLGGDYQNGIDYAIKKGIIGSNVTIKVYADSNVNIKFLKDNLKKYKWLFNNIFIFRNAIYEDIGTTIDKIKLEKFIL